MPVVGDTEAPASFAPENQNDAQPTKPRGVGHTIGALVLLLGGGLIFSALLNASNVILDTPAQQMGGEQVGMFLGVVVFCLLVWYMIRSGARLWGGKCRHGFYGAFLMIAGAQFGVFGLLQPLQMMSDPSAFKIRAVVAVILCFGIAILLIVSQFASDRKAKTQQNTGTTTP